MNDADVDAQIPAFAKRVTAEVDVFVTEYENCIMMILSDVLSDVLIANTQSAIKTSEHKVVPEMQGVLVSKTKSYITAHPTDSARFLMDMRRTLEHYIFVVFNTTVERELRKYLSGSLTTQVMTNIRESSTTKNMLDDLHVKIMQAAADTNAKCCEGMVL